MIVGLCGYAKSGKDTIAEALGTHDRVAFADALKIEVAVMLQAIGIHVDFNNPVDKEEWRDLLVFWGRKRREQDKDYWIKQMFLRNAHLFHGKNSQVIITDVRYPNEAKWVLNKNGLVIYVSRPDVWPNNDEERTSIQLIQAILKDQIYTLINDASPDKVAQSLRRLLSERRRELDYESKKKKSNQDNLPHHC